MNFRSSLLFLVLLFLCAWRCPAADPSVEMRLDEYLAEGLDWNFSRGNEFPGAAGKLELAPDALGPGRPGIRAIVDLSGGGKYVGLGRSLADLEARDILALRMKIKTSDIRNLTIRISDSSGQTHQKKNLPLKADGQWHDYEFRIADLVGAEHWGGLNDGLWHGPGKHVFISLTERAVPDSKKGVILFGDLRVDALPAGELPAVTYFDENFEKGALPAGWEKRGNVEVADEGGFSGRHAVRFARTADKFDEETSLVGAAVPVRTGRAEISGAFKSELKSPDASFNASVDVEALDGQGRVIETLKLANLSGPSNWTPLKKAIVFPASAASARLRVQLNKASGRFWADNLALRAPEVKSAPRSPIKRIILKTSEPGNMFLPGTAATFDATVQTFKPLPKDGQAITTWVTDYWGAELSKPMVTPLTAAGRKKGVFAYTAKIDLSSFAPETGRYYELQTEVKGGAGDPARQASAFVFLPEAATKAYSWREVPFSSRNWDNRMQPYFVLSDRLGIRLAGVWGTWKAEPPFKPSAPGFETIKKLGMTMLARTPIVDVEHHRPGYEAYTDEVLRSGVASFFEKFGRDGEIVITLGNEPPGTGPTVDRNVAMYKLMYEEVKKVSPQTFVVGTSVGPAEEYFKRGFQKYSDAVDFHTYEDSKGLEKTFARYKELFAKYGGEQPIWATEMGLNAQGLSRRAVAAELIKKFSWFFSFGGANASWFGICYPDREGKGRGSAEDAFNVFDGLYGNYSPRLDAVAYYNVVNGICIKKFADHRDYGDGLQAFLFLDQNGDNLLVLWKDHGAADVRMPLQGAGPARLTRIDGTTAQLEADGGLDLRVTGDPILIAYKGGQKKLAGKLSASRVTLQSAPEKVVRGETFSVALETDGLPAGDLAVSVPPGWKAAPLAAKDGRIEAVITAPADTGARYVPIRFQQKHGDLELVLPVQGQVAAELNPVVLEGGRPGVELVLHNNNARPEEVDWKLSLQQQIAPKGGLYAQTAAEPPMAYFGEAADGQASVDARGERRLRVPLEGVDPITSYKIRATVTDQSGRSLLVDRFFAGFVLVPKARAAIAADGKLDEPDWQRAMVQKVDRTEQFRHLLPTSKWSGPEDLSGEVRFLWDDHYLYVGVKVRDDVFRNESDGSSIWAGDGLQFLIDPARSRADKTGKYDYAVGKGKSGPVAWCYLTADGQAPAGEVKEILTGIAPSEGGKGGMTYEIAIPWTRLRPFQPKPGANLGMAVIMNEDDAPKRDGFMTWFGDIQSKEVDPVGDLILTE